MGIANLIFVCLLLMEGALLIESSLGRWKITGMQLRILL